MRWLVVVSLVCMSAPQAQNLPAPRERAAVIAAAARDAAAEIERGVGYGDLLFPLRSQRLEVRDWPGTVFFGPGWASLETWGVWSIGSTSQITLRLDSDDIPTAIYIHGRYYQGEEDTRLWINDVLVAEGPLDHRVVPLPPGMAATGSLHIQLEHINPLSPHDVDPQKQDYRKLKFGLTEIGVR